MNYDVNGYSAREIPFYGLPTSKVVREASTAHDAMQLAGLDWDVSLTPIYQQMRDGSFHAAPNMFLTVRETDEKPLGKVGKVYVPFQNSSAFEFVDELLGHGVEFDAAGSYDSDRKVFLTAKLPDGLVVPGTDDTIDWWLFFKNSHDGSCAITCMITPIRMSCTNMFNLALHRSAVKWTCRHTSKAGERINEAARTLHLVDSYKEEFEAISKQLFDTEMNIEGFENLIEELTDSERLQRGMINTWQNSPTVDRTTAWGGLNAIGEFMEWERGGKGSPESRFASNLDGQTANMRNRALQLLIR